MSSKPLEEAIRTLPTHWFRPNRLVYWCDLLGSTAIGWTAFAFALASRGWRCGALLMVAGFALYRAGLFIHEITHLARRDVPGFAAAWNALIGVPLLLPSFLYEGVHNDHHRQHNYGTVADPEYLPFGRRSPGLIAGFVLGSALLPFALVFRFGILAPLSWICPPLRRAVAARASALALNPRYVRRAPLDAAARLEETAACAVVWGLVLAFRADLIATDALIAWMGFLVSASTLNALRTLAAHRYDRDGGELTMLEQLLDSCTIAGAPSVAEAGISLCRTAVAPVGLRYHALHHWIPSLPYHNLGRAHRRLVASLGAEAPYRVATHPGFGRVFDDLLRRSAAHR